MREEECNNEEKEQVSPLHDNQPPRYNYGISKVCGDIFTRA
jgi:hypothetical protein